MSKIRELHQKRQKLLADAKEIIEKSEKEKRSNLNTEETQAYDKLFADAEEVRIQIDRLVKLEEAEKQSREMPEKWETKDESKSKSPRASKEYRDAFNSYLKNGPAMLNVAETRALSAGSDPDGGALVAPEQFVASLIKFVDDQVFVRQFATKFMIQRAQSLGVPSLETDPADADWTSEIATGSEDSSMKFGKRALNPSPLAKRIKVSQTLLRIATLSAEDIVMQRLGYKFAISEEKAFLTGTGANQPLGVFTASTYGITTSRDVSTGNSTTAIAADNLFEVKYALKGQYHSRAAWMFHRDAVKQIAKLKDGNGQYLWVPSLQAGTPDRLLNMPVYMSEYAPNTFTTGLYVGILGDWSQYYIADSMDMTVQRLVELYAESNQVGFIGRMEVDGMPVLQEAFARVKLA